MSYDWDWSVTVIHSESSPWYFFYRNMLNSMGDNRQPCLTPTWTPVRKTSPNFPFSKICGVVERLDHHCGAEWHTMVKLMTLGPPCFRFSAGRLSIARYFSIHPHLLFHLRFSLFSELYLVFVFQDIWIEPINHQHMTLLSKIICRKNGTDGLYSLKSHLKIHFFL